MVGLMTGNPLAEAVAPIGQQTRDRFVLCLSLIAAGSALVGLIGSIVPLLGALAWSLCLRATTTAVAAFALAQATGGRRALSLLALVLGVAGMAVSGAQQLLYL